MKYIAYLMLIFSLYACKEIDFFSLSSIGVPSSQENIEDKTGCQEGICDITETFNLIGFETALDMVLILDVSPSMRGNLKKLGLGLSSVLSYIKDFNWQMVFTTADHGDHSYNSNQRLSNQTWQNYSGNQPRFGQLMNLELKGKRLHQIILHPALDNYKQIFLDTLTVNPGNNTCLLAPYCQRAHEQPLRALKATMERDNNRYFFREEADLVSIIITNEDERDQDPKNATTAQEVKDTFETQFDESKSFYSFNILIKDKDKRCKTNQSKQSKGKIVQYGLRISKLADITNGANISICEKDYGKSLENISKLIKNRLLSHVYLNTTFPDPNSIRINTSPYQKVKWELNGRYITFTPALQYGTVVEVTYKPFQVEQL